MDKSFKWAIAGTGKIAIDFASQIAALEGASLHSVYSRDKANAMRFQQAFGMAVGTDDFEDLLKDDAVDAIYVALPSAQHHDFTIRALNAKKPVLVEKPFAPTLAEAEAMINAAKANNTFCMEAMWMRFSPIIRGIRKKLEIGDLGEIKSISIQAGYATPPGRLIDNDPGRGALLNFGVYAISLAQMLLGDPQAVSADIIKLDNGLDETCSLRLSYPKAHVNITVSIGAELSNEATICATQGRYKLGSPFFTPGYAEFTSLNRPKDGPVKKPTPVNALPKLDKLPYLGLAQGAFWSVLLRRRGGLLKYKPGDNGLRLEAKEVMTCLQEKRIESHIMSHADTLSVARIVDQARSA